MSIRPAVQQVWNHMIKSKGFGQHLAKVNLISADNGACTAEMTVEPEHTNNFNTLHGGLTSTLVDVISTIALSTKSGQWGVSVDLHVSFLKAAALGETLVIEAKTIREGKTLAFLDVLIKEKNTGKVVGTGSHTKFVGKPL